MRRTISRVSVIAVSVSLWGQPALAEGRPQADEIVVTAAASDRSGLGTKTDTKLLEVPQSITIVTRAEMDLRNVQSMPEAVRYVAGVQVQPAGLDSRSDDINIRGFDAGGFTSNQYFDGLRSQPGGQWTILQYDAHNLERVEVLKGPSAVLYGAVAPGGLVNMVTKRPLEEVQGEVSVQYASHNQFRGTFDTTGPVNEEGSLRYRVVGMYRDGDSEVDHTSLGRWFVAPSVTWQPSLDTTLTVLGHYQKDFGGSSFQFVPTYGTIYENPLGKIRSSDFFGEPTFNTFDREQWAVGYGLVHRINDSWQVRQNARFTKISSVYEAVVSDDLFTPESAEYFGIDLDDPGMWKRMERRAVRGVGSSESWAIDIQSQWDFATGGIEHVLLAGVDFFHTQYKHERRGAYSDSDPGVPPLLDIFNPVYAGGIDTSSFETQFHEGARNRQIGLYLQDQIRVGELRFTLGGRNDWVRTNFQDYAFPDGSYKNDQSAFTWRAGATWVSKSGLAPYVSYAESFDPTTGTDAEGNIFRPTRGQQYELGVKYELAQGKGSITLSAYDLRQKNVLTADPACGADPYCYDQVQTGELRVRGIELESTLRPVNGLYLTGSVTYMDGEITKDNTGLVGNRIGYVPNWIASLYADYTVKAGTLAGLGLGAGVRYTGGLYGDIENTVRVPGYTLVDAALRYDIGGEPGERAPWRIALNVSNLFDKDALSSCTAWGCGFISGRNVTVNLGYRW